MFLIVTVMILLLSKCFTVYYKTEPKDKTKVSTAIPVRLLYYSNHLSVLLYIMVIFTQGRPSQNISCHYYNEYFKRYSSNCRDDGCGGFTAYDGKEIKINSFKG